MPDLNLATSGAWNPKPTAIPCWPKHLPGAALLATVQCMIEPVLAAEHFFSVEGNLHQADDDKVNS
jgi:hypothetical protein